MTLESIAQFIALQLEGPYKWYAILVIVGLITAFVTRFIFRTVKWFLILVAIVVIVLYLWSQAQPFLSKYLPFIGARANQPGRLEVILDAADKVITK